MHKGDARFQHEIDLEGNDQVELAEYVKQNFVWRGLELVVEDVFEYYYLQNVEYFIFRIRR